MKTMEIACLIEEKFILHTDSIYSDDRSWLIGQDFVLHTIRENSLLYSSTWPERIHGISDTSLRNLERLRFRLTTRKQYLFSKCDHDSDTYYPVNATFAIIPPPVATFKSSG